MYNEVQFEDQNVDFHRNARVVQKSTMVKLFEKMGVPEEYVSVVMIGVAILAFIFSIYILKISVFKGTNQDKHAIYQEDLTPTIRATLPQSVLNTIPYKYKHAK